MPKVGDKEFAYTPEGVAKAKQESEETGIPISDGAKRGESYQLGGLIPGQQGFGQKPIATPPAQIIGQNPMVDPLAQGIGQNPIVKDYEDKFLTEQETLGKRLAEGGMYKKGGRVRYDGVYMSEREAKKRKRAQFRTEKKKVRQEQREKIKSVKVGDREPTTKERRKAVVEAHKAGDFREKRRRMTSDYKITTTRAEAMKEKRRIRRKARKKIKSKKQWFGLKKSK